MIWPDIAILVIVSISALISLFRGFVREVLSVVAWVVAFWVAFRFSSKFAPLFEAFVELPSVRTVLAFVVLLVATLVVIGLVNFLIAKIIDSTGLTGTDRALGMIFGILRGVAIVGVLVFLAGATPFPQDDWWRQSIFISHFEELAEFMLQFLPPNFAKHFSFDLSA